MTSDTRFQARQLPHGLADLFYEQAAIKTELESRLQDTFRGWGYQRIITPTFEYDTTLSTEASPQLAEEMYRLIDREGRILALRPDMTVPTARVVGTRLYDQTLPLRFYYVGSVFRYDEEPQAGRRREFTQAGIELVGAGTPEADAEVVAVAIGALEAMEVPRFQINLGQVGFLKAILADAGGGIRLENGDLRRVEAAVHRKNDRALRDILDELHITGRTADAVAAIPYLCGDVAVLDEARHLATNAEATAAVERLAAVYELLDRAGVADRVSLDLGEVRSMAYYTGISFHGYAAGLGFDVCSGGRYDGLISHFGADLPAVGFALGVERCMIVAQVQCSVAPQVVVQGSANAAAHHLAALARARGLRVEMDVMGRTGDALIAYGRERGARYIITPQTDGRYRLIATDGERTLRRGALEKEIATWTP
jgi:ATP phosphoribosyltransferase regulatory subunit